MRSHSPATEAQQVAKKRYTYAGIFLVVTLISFTVQTELAAWVQHNGWDKAYAMLYLTHGSWALLWPVQLLILRVQQWDRPWHVFWRDHVWLLKTTAGMVQRQDLEVPARSWETHNRGQSGPLRYLVRTTAMITTALTIAGLAWYLAVNMTSPSDLTAIYNCSAFFAYAFSVPLLKERLRLDKSVAVIVAIVGVLVVAYGDAKEPGDGHKPAKPPATGGPAPPPGAETHHPDSDAGERFLGNLIIGAGSVLYGLYEVLYKRFACPPDGVSPNRGMIFANTFGSMIGCFTLFVLWIPLPFLHWAGVEEFALPTGKVALMLFLSVVMNATFAGSFLVLISLTSPVLSSVAALLTIFIVALSDWFLTGEPPSMAAMLGGLMIILAFLVLSWSSYKEMAEEEAHQKQKAEHAPLDFALSDDDDSDSESDKERP